MNDRMCTFTWNTYSDHLREMLHQMKKSNEFTDVTLVCDDMRQFQAHKVVLSACSSVFKRTPQLPTVFHTTIFSVFLKYH